MSVGIRSNAIFAESGETLNIEDSSETLDGLVHRVAHVLILADMRTDKSSGVTCCFDVK